jgi:hypothetical protein
MSAVATIGQSRFAEEARRSTSDLGVRHSVERIAVSFLRHRPADSRLRNLGTLRSASTDELTPEQLPEPTGSGYPRALDHR